MAIKRRPSQASSIDNFIDGAPDASADDQKPKRVRKGNKVQISFTLDESLLDRVDEQSSKMSLSRAAFINLALFKALNSGMLADD